MSSKEMQEITEAKQSVKKAQKAFLSGEKQAEAGLVTKDMLIASIGRGYAKSITDEIVGMINSEPDSTTREIFRDNIISFKEVLDGSSYSMKQYTNALKYMTFRTHGSNKLAAFTRTFPDKFQATIDKYGAEKGRNYLHAYSASYNKTQLVTAIMGKALVPNHILYFDLNHKAITTLAHLMEQGKSEHVRVKAAEILVNIVKAPEDRQINIDIGQNDYDPIKVVGDAISKLAKQQMKAISDGMSITEAANVVVDVSVEKQAG